MALLFETFLAKLNSGTLTYEEVKNANLSMYEKEALLDGLVDQGIATGTAALVETNPSTTPSEQVVVTGTQAAAPTGTWSSWIVQVPSTSAGSITVDGLEVAVGSSQTASADPNKTIPSPVIVDGGNNYNWKGYRY